jgi:hypothetical protein
MGIFILIILSAALVGVQLGVYSVLKHKGITAGRAILYSFGIYAMPFLILQAHIYIYRKRYLLIQTLGKKQKMNAEQLASLGETLNSYTFLVLSVWSAIKDIFTLADNIIVFVEIMERHDKKRNTKSLLERFGIFGLFSKSASVVRNGFVNHASDQLYLSKYVA